MTAIDLEALDVPADRRQARQMLVRAVAADHGLGARLHLVQLVAIATTYGLRPEAERAAAIEAALSSGD